MQLFPLVSISSVWGNVWPILVAILLFVFVILFHELGHFLAAKLMGVRVNEFALGFGPTLWKRRGKETTYAIHLIPFGGFCAMEGEDQASADGRAFCNKKAWRRFVIIVMGGLFNILLGFILVLFSQIPSEQFLSTTVSSFHAEASSAQTGLQEGDTIVNVNGRHVFTTVDLAYAFTNVDEDGKMDITVRRNGERVTLKDVAFGTKMQDDINYISVDFYVQSIEKNPLTYLSQAAKTTLSYGRVVWFSLVDLITGKYGVSQVSGPVGVTVAIGNAARASFDQLLSLITIITINLGIFNLLPIPALDGGRLLFILFEMIFRKPVPQKFEGMVHAVGFVILIGLILLITLKDIIGLFS